MFACQHPIKSAPMGSDEYRRLRAAFLTMAQQSDLPNVQTRWLALAQACSNLAHEGSTHARINPSFQSHAVVVLACGKDVRVTGITPERPGFEQRTFECATCGDETILMDPIRYGRETPWNPR